MIRFMNVFTEFVYLWLHIQEVCKSCRGNRVVRGSKRVNLDVMPGMGFNVIVIQ
jgi:hypothetical protein